MRKGVEAMKEKQLAKLTHESVPVVEAPSLVKQGSVEEESKVDGWSKTSEQANGPASRIVSPKSARRQNGSPSHRKSKPSWAVLASKRDLQKDSMMGKSSSVAALPFSPKRLNNAALPDSSGAGAKKQQGSEKTGEEKATMSVQDQQVSTARLAQPLKWKQS